MTTDQIDSIKLAVIINSFNRLQLLKQSLESITQAVQKLNLDTAIIIFDAGSTDGSIQYIEKNFNKISKSSKEKKIYLIFPSSKDETSFSHGCNSAVAFATERLKELEYFLFFETDNFIKDASSLFQSIQLLASHEKLAAVGFTVELFDGRKAGFGASFPSPLSFILGQQISNKLGLNKIKHFPWNDFEGNRWLTCETVFTSPLLVKLSAWHDIGPMDAERFPFSDCDTDWCWRAKQKGWSMAVLDVPGVIHDNQQQQSLWSLNRVLNFHQSRLRLLLKHKGNWIKHIRPLLFLRHCAELSVLAFKSVLDEKAKRSLVCRVELIKVVFSNYEY